MHISQNKVIVPRLKFDDSFFGDVFFSWAINFSFHHEKNTFSMLGGTNGLAEKNIKLVQHFGCFITVEGDQRQFLLRYVQEHRHLIS